MKKIYKYIITVLTLVVLILIVMMVRQHRHYAEVRRIAAQDHQQVLHGQSFHSITFLALESGRATVAEDQLLDALKQIVRTSNKKGQGELIYAGRVLMNAMISPQLKQALGQEVAWDAILVQQFEDRAAYDDYASDPEVQQAMQNFDKVYVHGMQRSAVPNLLLPQFLLGIKLWRTITFAPSPYPFQKSQALDNVLLAEASQSMREGKAGLGKDAVVVINLIQDGNSVQQSANRKYSKQMLGLMAERGYGPIHVGKSVPIQLPLEYDSVAIVYYPGRDYFREMATSKWFQNIIQDKQLADTQATITAPITDLLESENGF